MAVTGTNSLYFASGLDNSGLLKGKVQAEGIIQSMATNISRINPFAAIGVGIIATSGIVARESYQMVKEFDKAMKEVKTISDAAQNDYQGISNLVFDLSKISPDTPKELAEAYYQVVSAGYDGAEGLDVLAASSKAAVAGVTDTKTAADGLTTILNSYKLSASDSEKVSDSLFNTVKLGKTTFGELSASISQVAPIASASNIALDEILSSVATLTKQGVPTVQAMTQIRSAIVGLSEAGKLDGAKTLQENMQALYDEMNGNQTAIQNEVGRIEAVQAILAVSGKNAKSASKDLESYNDVVGATAKANRIMLEEEGKQWQIFSNRIKALTKGTGDAVLSASTSIAKDLNKLIGIRNDSSKAIDTEANSIRNLIDHYRDANPETDERLDILKQLESINPSIVDGINNEADAYKVLTENLSEYNEALVQRRYVASQRDEATSIQNDILDVRDSQKIANESFRKSIQEFAISKRVQDFEPLKQVVEDVQNLNISEFEKVKKIQAYLDSDSFKGAGFTFFDDNQGFDIDDRLFALYKARSLSIGILSDRLEGLNKEIKDSELAFYNLDSEFNNVISSINKVNTSEGLEAFSNDGFRQEIKDAVTARELIIKEFEKIGKINIANQSDLEPFLNSENEEIKNRALEKQAQFNDIQKENQDIANKNYEEYLKKFKAGIDKEKKEFERRDKLLELNKNTEADALGKEGTFKDYLLNQFDSSKSQTEKNILLDYIQPLKKSEVETEVDKTKKLIDDAFSRDFFTNLGIDSKGVFESLENYGGNAIEVLKKKYEELQKVDITPANAEDVKKQFELLGQASDKLNLNFDFTSRFVEGSIDAINQKIRELTDKYNSASEADRPSIKIAIEIEQDKLAKITTVVDEFAEKINSIRNGDKGLFNISAISKLISERKKLQATLDAGGLNEKEQAKTTANLKEAGFDLNQAIIGGLEDAASILSGASELFSKFGDDKTAGLLDQLSGVASGVGRIASGDIIGGSLAVLNSAITVTVESDTAKFEQAIEDFERASVKITNAITNSVGSDVAKNKASLIENIKDQEEQLRLAQEAEEEARKAVKFLGVKVGDKGSGSGTDQAKLDELAAKAEEAKQKVIELEKEYNEFFTGTTGDAISDAILQGLEAGKRGIDDFAETFDKIMTDSILETFKREKLAEATSAFLNEYANAANSDKSTQSDINETIRNLEDQLIDAEEKEKHFSTAVDYGANGAIDERDEQRALIASIKQQIENEKNKLELIANGVGTSDLTVNEIAELRNVFNEAIGQATSDFEALQEFLEDAGIETSDLEANQAQTGLTGSIRSQLTEETGSELAGLQRGMYDINKQHFQATQSLLASTENISKTAIQSMNHLESIRQNTANTVTRLDTLISRTEQVITNTQGTSNTARDLGY